LELAVHLELAQLRVVDRDHDRDRVDDPLEELALPAQLAFSPHAFRDVASDADHADDLAALVAQGALRRQEVAALAPDDRGVLDRARLSGLEHLAVLGDGEPGRFRFEDVEVGLAEYLLQRPTDYPRARLVDEDVAPFEVLDEHRVGGRLQHGPEQVPTLA